MTVPFEEVRLRLPHIELAAHLYGPEDGLPVIALHGWLDNSMSFARLAPKLEGLRIVALDQAGHGHSEHRPIGAEYHSWDYVHDVLQVADQFGWKRFNLLGHSMGAIGSVLLAGAMPDRVERLALIDGLTPFTGEAEQSPAKLGSALKSRLALAGKRKPVYKTIEEAVAARMKGDGAVSFEAAELLAQRGLMPVPGGYTWRTDSRLTLPTPVRLTAAHTRAFVKTVACPARLIVAERGILMKQPNLQELLEGTRIETEHLPGGHHLHLDDEAGAQAVAGCFNRFFGAA